MIAFKHEKNSFINRTISSFIAVTFLTSLILPPQGASAQSVLNLPVPGKMVSAAPIYIPALVKGVTINPENPLEFDFIIDTGHSEMTSKELEVESKKLIKYFLASLTVSEKNTWVNLSPYEEGRTIPETFGKTEMGRDLLAQDYLLKQLTASMMYPEDKLGKEFWNRVYTKAKEQYGTTDIPMNTFNKIWILPEKAKVYENENGAYVVNSRLKVMLEEDFVALQKNLGNDVYGLDGLDQKDADAISGVTSEVVREVLIPEIEKEVNEGKTFANLRQIYNSVILATWFKLALKESLLGKIYVDQGKVKGVDVRDKGINQKIYQQYVDAFKKGVYNYIREDYDAQTQEIIPRKYFSGGIPIETSKVLERTKTLTADDNAMVTSKTGEIIDVKTQLYAANKHNARVVSQAEGNDFAMASRIKPQNLMSQLQLSMNVLGLSEYDRMVDIAVKSLDALAFRQSLIAALGGDEQAAEKVTAALANNKTFSPKSLKAQVLEKINSKEGLDKSTSQSKRVEVTVSADRISLGDSTEIQKLESGKLHDDFLADQYAAAKVGKSPYNDDAHLFLGRFLGMFEPKPEYFKQQKPINGQELNDLRDEIDAIKGYLRGQVGSGKKLDISVIQNLISNGIGANEMYLHQQAQMINDLAKIFGVGFHWEVIDNTADIDRILRNSINPNEENILEFDESRSGGTAEGADFMEATTRKDGLLYVKNRIAWSNGSRFHRTARRQVGIFSVKDLEEAKFTPEEQKQMINFLILEGLVKAEPDNKLVVQDEVVKELQQLGSLSKLGPVQFVSAEKEKAVLKILGQILEAKDETASVFQIDNTPGNIGGRHMNVKTGMVYDPLFTALALLGNKIIGDVEKGFDWAEEMLKVYVKSSLDANLALSPKQDSEQAALYNAASVLSTETVRKRDIEKRNKLAMIFDPSLRNETTAFFQNTNEGFAKPAKGKERNNNMFSFWDATNRKQDYMKVFTSSPEDYQPFFIVNLSSQNAERMLREANELQEKGVPVKIIKVDMRKLEGKTNQDVEQAYKHNIATVARMTAVLQTFVTTFSALTDQDANSNPAVKMTREFTAAIQEILEERRNEKGSDLTTQEKRVTLPQILEKIVNKKQALVKEAKDKLTSIIESEKTKKIELVDEFNTFIVNTLEPLANELNLDSDVVAGAFIGSVSFDVFSADTAESGGLKSTLIDVMLDNVEFGDILGNLTEDFKLKPLSGQKDVYAKDGLIVSLAVPENMSAEEEADYKIQSIVDLPKALAAYYKNRLSEEGKWKTFNTIGLAYMDADTGNEYIEDSMSIINDNLAGLGINALPMNFPRIAHTGIEAAQALAEIISVIGLIPTKSYEEGEGKLGSLLIREGMTVNDANKIYNLANVARMAFGGSPTIIFEYEDKGQLGEIRNVLMVTMGLLAEEIVRLKESKKQEDNAIVVDGKVAVVFNQVKRGVIEGPLSVSDVVDRIIEINESRPEIKEVIIRSAALAQKVDHAIQKMVAAGIVAPSVEKTQEGFPLYDVIGEPLSFGQMQEDAAMTTMDNSDAFNEDFSAKVNRLGWQALRSLYEDMPERIIGKTHILEKIQEQSGPNVFADEETLSTELDSVISGMLASRAISQIYNLPKGIYMMNGEYLQEGADDLAMTVKFKPQMVLDILREVQTASPDNATVTTGGVMDLVVENNVKIKPSAKLAFEVEKVLLMLKERGMLTEGKTEFGFKLFTIVSNPDAIESAEIEEDMAMATDDIVDISTKIDEAIDQIAANLRPGDVISDERVMNVMLLNLGSETWKLQSLRDVVPSLLSSKSKGDDSKLIAVEGGYKLRNLGGINLDPSLMELSIERDSKGVPLPLDNLQIENINVDGFIPVIINIVPVPSMNMLLGLKEKGENSTSKKLTYEKGLSPYDEMG